jgi:hypothetical protein
MKTIESRRGGVAVEDKSIFFSLLEIRWLSLLLQTCSESPNLEKYMEGMDRHIQLGYKSRDNPGSSLPIQLGPMWIE